MATEKNHFSYYPARKVSGWAVHFDSLTELRYVLSIMEEFYFLRSPVSIYYHPTTRLTTERTRKYHLRYTPDFLIRHKETLQAFLIEIKPRAFEQHPQLALRKAVAENYITRKNLDWTFKIVYDDQIILSEQQLEDFEACTSLHSSTAITAWFKDYYRRHAHATPDNALRDFIITGPQNKHPTWKQMRLL